MDVPITPSVLRWAMDEAGVDEPQLAKAASVSADTLQGWLQGHEKPTLTQVRKLAQALHRQLAVFLLPSPPPATERALELRASPGSSRRPLNPVERRHVRRTERLQEVVSWLTRELGAQSAQLPAARIDEPAVDAAARFRSALQVSVEQQTRFKSLSHAFDRWREALGSLGVLVFQFPLGRESCRGFSLWDADAPVIVINTAWNEAARIYTLFHELGHLITRTESACGDGDLGWRVAQHPDRIERWCEEFAAAALLPEPAVRAFVLDQGGASIAEVAAVRRLARKFHVSLTASCLRLVELGLARRELFADLPKRADFKDPQGGGASGGRTVAEIRHDEIGDRTVTLFHKAVSRGVLEETQALTYLDAPPAIFGAIAQ